MSNYVHFVFAFSEPCSFKTFFIHKDMSHCGSTTYSWFMPDNGQSALSSQIRAAWLLYRKLNGFPVGSLCLVWNLRSSSFSGLQEFQNCSLPKTLENKGSQFSESGAREGTLRVSTIAGTQISHFSLVFK